MMRAGNIFANLQRSIDVNGLRGNVMSTADEFFSEPGNRNKFPGIKAVLNTWNNARGDYFAPRWSASLMMAFPTEIISNCSVLDVMPEGPEFVFCFWGTRAANVTRQEMTGKSIWDIRPRALAEIAYRDVCEVISQREPLLFENYLKDTIGLEGVIGSCRIPFSSDGSTIDKIMNVVEGVPSVLAAFSDEMKKRTGEP
jgi:hypothetical protein